MADDESIRGSLKGRLPRLRDKGKHKAKIMASREALGRGESMFDLTARPTTAPNQLIEDWNMATRAELEAGKGGLFSAFKEKVQVVAQRQAQAQIEKELKEVNEFRTKVAASVDEKLLDYTNQMAAANRNIATVTARLHNLSSNITEEKITQLLAGIVKPYFEALSGDTSKRLDLMEERSDRAEKERTEQFERELVSSADRLSSLELATSKTNTAAEAKMEDIFTMAMDTTTTTERQLSEINSTFHDIKVFTKTIPRLAAETKASTESAATKLVQSAELAARQIIQEADDSNRAETAKLNQFRTDELQKLERSLQSIGENTIQTVRTDLSNLTKTMRSATSDQVETINHAVTRGKVHVEYIQDHIEKADRNLDRSFKNLASEIKQLNEDVTHTMTRTQNAERLATASVANIEVSLTSAKASIETAEKNLSNMKIDVERLNDKFLEDGATVFENFENGFRAMKRDSGIFLDDYVQEIESKTNVAGRTIERDFDHLMIKAGDSFNKFVENFQDVSARSAEEFQKTNRDSGVFLDECLQKFEQSSTKSGKSLDECARKIEENTSIAELSIAKSFSRLTKETEDSLDGHIEAIHMVTSQAGEAVSSISEGLENLKQDFVHSLDGSAEKIQNALSQAGGTVFEVERSMEKLRSEATNHLNIQVDRIEKSGLSTESIISSAKIGLEKDMNSYIEKIHCLNTQSQKSLASAISQELERTKTETTDYLDIYTKRIEGVNAHAEAKLFVVTENLERIASDSSKAMDVYAQKVEDSGIRAGENLSSIVSKGLDVSKKETEKCFNTYVDRIQSINTCVEEFLASIMQQVEAVHTRTGEKLSTFLPELESTFEKSLTRHETMSKTLNSEFVTHHQDLTQKIKLDMVQWSEKKDHETQTIMQSMETLVAEKRLAHQRELAAWEEKKQDELRQTLEKWDIALDGKMAVAVESFLQRLEVHSRTIQEVALTSKEEMVERYVTTLQTCNEERQAHVKDLKSVDGRLEGLDRVLSLIAGEMGCLADPFIGAVINPPDSPVTASGLRFSSSTTIKSRFDEASVGISEILNFCEVFRSQVNDISRAVGTVASGETFSTMLYDNTRITESLVRLIGAPSDNSSLWNVIERIEDSRKKGEDVYDRLDTVFQETRIFISNANGALGYVPVTLQDISASTMEFSESMATSLAVAHDSKTLTDSLGMNLRNSVQALSRFKEDAEKISKAINTTGDLILEGKKAAESGNTIVSEMQEALSETSKSVEEMVNSTSSMSKSLEISKTMVEGFRTEAGFLKDSVSSTKESIDGSSALTNFYEEDLKAIGGEFKTATETLKHVTGSISTLRDSVCSLREDMTRTKVTVGETRKIVEDLIGDTGDAEFSIESCTGTLTSLSETIKATDPSFANISTTMFESKESLKKLSDGIRDPETMVEKASMSLNALTELAQAAESSIVEALALIQDKSKEMAQVEIPILVELEHDSHLAGREHSVNSEIDALPVTIGIRPQSPKRPASTAETRNQDSAAEEGSSVRHDARQDADNKAIFQSSFNKHSPASVQSDDTKCLSRPRSASNKRRRLGSFFYIPQWMSPPVVVATKDASSHSTSTATGISTKKPDFSNLGRDESGSSRSELAVDNSGLTLGDVEATPTITSVQSQVEVRPPQEYNSNADAAPDGHVRCGDCMDGVSGPANNSKPANDNTDIISDTANRSGVLNITIPATAVLAKRRTRRNGDEEDSIYVPSSLSNEAMMIWRHRGL